MVCVGHSLESCWILKDPDEQGVKQRHQEACMDFLGAPN